MARVTIELLVNGVQCCGLVDSGCSQSIVSSRLLKSEGQSRDILAVDGHNVRCDGEVCCKMVIYGNSFQLRCLVLQNLVAGIDVILGLDAISHLGGVTINDNGLKFGKQCCATINPLSIEDADFRASFDGQRWVISWEWKSKPPILSNKISEYGIKPSLRNDYESEISKWITEEWLIPCNDSSEGILPLLVIEQESKHKVRPVLDFRELNLSVNSHTGDSEVCGESLMKWRRMGDKIVMLDLRNAYLQLHVSEDLWKFQRVKYKGKMYYLTRLGFGLNCAPKIMSAVLGKVLSLDDRIRNATDHYIDDIAVDTEIISVEEVVAHLARYGLTTKSPEPIGSANILGLKVDRKANGQLIWSRGSAFPAPELDKAVSRRQLFSICGKLIGHYPVAGWLRVACSYLKRCAEGAKWNDEVGTICRQRLKDVIDKVSENDPVKGVWSVDPCKKGVVWCDASSIAMGAVVEINGTTVEDAAWLRKKDDHAHINVAELNAVLKGISLAVKWGISNLVLMVDSATVVNWLNTVLSNNGKIRVHGLSETLVKRRLGIIQEILEDGSLEIVVKLIKSADNRADALTRVPRAWLNHHRSVACLGMSMDEIKRSHDKHHFGYRRTKYFVLAENKETSNDLIQQAVRNCKECKSIDPSPVRWDVGSLEVERNWERLAIDVTHFKGSIYLTVVDCGPSRFAIWRKLGREDAASVVSNIEEIFRERGPVTELLMDNGSSFRSELMRDLCLKWGIKMTFRCAYRPSGNGIVERNHRTIKSRATRTRCDPRDIVFWYNVAPMIDTKQSSAPSDMLFNYHWKFLPRVDKLEHPSSTYAKGQSVYVKPSLSKCTSVWPVGTVTNVNSSTNVEVDGMPRHVADIRAVPDDQVENNSSASECGVSTDGEITDAAEDETPRRLRRPPKYFDQYVRT